MLSFDTYINRIKIIYIYIYIDGKFNIKYFYILSFILFTFEIFSYAFKSYFIAAWINSFIIGFFIPDLIKRLPLEKFLKLVIVLLAISTILNLAKIYIRYDLLGQLNNAGLAYKLATYYINYSRVIFALAIMLTIIYLCKLFEQKIKNRNLYILDFSDKYSYSIYIVHMIYSKGIFCLIGKTDNLLIDIFIMLIIIIISAILFKFFASVLDNRFNIMRRA